MSDANNKDLKVLHGLIQGSVKKGYLFKQGAGIKNWKKRWFCLRRNELYYFENSTEIKLMGKFTITKDWKVSEGDDKKLKKDFTIKISGQTLKEDRYLCAENEKQRSEWIFVITSTIAEAQEGKYDVLIQGNLFKANPAVTSFQKRFVQLKASMIFYYKNDKDLLPCGFINLAECNKVDSATDLRPLCFFVSHPNRRYYFQAETQQEFDSWYDTIRSAMGLQKSVLPTVVDKVPRETLLLKPIKEGVLYKKRNLKNATKPVRLVLTSNFLYYFPVPSSTEKVHTMHVMDIVIEPVPPSLEKMPYSFRVWNTHHPFYLGAEDEKEFDTWVNLIGSSKSNFQNQLESKTDKDVVSSGFVDFTVQILHEVVDTKAESVTQAKTYEVRVKAFWTQWVMKKTYQDFVDLHSRLLKQFPSFIFPEMIYEPLYLDELDATLKASLTPPQVKRTRSFLQLSKGPGTVKQKSSDKYYDINFLQCMLRELVRNQTVSQSEPVLSFFDLNNIFSAVRRGEIAAVRYFVDQKHDLNILTLNGLESPLHIAVKINHKQIVEVLLTAGANPNLPNSKGRTPLHVAAECGAIELIKLLLAHGGNLNATDELNLTPLHLCATKSSPDCLDYLLDKGANINAKDNGSRTALHLAILEGQTANKCVFRLVERGADMNAKDEEGFTPLMMATWKNRDEVVKFFVARKIPLDATDKYKRTALHLAVLRNNDEITRELVDAGLPINAVNAAGQTVLHIATSKGLLDMVEYLLGHGADIKVKDEKESQTPVHLASMGSKTEILEIFLERSRHFENQDVFLDTQDNNGKTALHLATESGNIASMKLLIESGVSMHVADNNYDTPLHIAASQGNLQAARLVADKKNLNYKNKNGQQPLHVAAAKGHQDVAAFLMTLKPELNTKDTDGNTPLHLACMNKKYEIAVGLAENGASISLMNNEGNTPLQYCTVQVRSQLQDIAKYSNSSS